MLYIALAFANFIYIFLKAFQSRNIAFLHYRWAMTTNVFLVAAEIFVMGNIALAVTYGGWVPILCTFVSMCAGGGTGCIASMYIHDKYLTRKEDAKI